MFESNSSKTAEVIGQIIGKITFLFLKALIIFIGLNILRKYGVSIPLFSYWEVLLLRMALGCLYPNYSQKKSEE